MSEEVSSLPPELTSPRPTGPSNSPRVVLRSLDTLWFQVGGTVCNLACSHCFISCSPTNHTHDFMTLRQVEEHLAEAAALGVKEFYFTGGEPFLNPEMEAILAATLKVGPATVLTNGLLLDQDRCRRLWTLSSSTDYSLEIRISIDGYGADANDPIRGEGTFDRILAGAARIASVGLNPVMTVTEVLQQNSSHDGRQLFFELLREHGVDRPRLKILPVFQIGAEAERSGAYESWQQLSVLGGDEHQWDHLQCSTSRMATDQGIWVCPILVNEPSGRMGSRLSETLGEFSLEHQACWTCHVYGVSCRN